ncbi:ROK family protein [soil metagenome]
MTRALIAAIETGGTKILCRVAQADVGRQVTVEIPPHRFATTTPKQAVADLVAAIRGAMGPGDALAALGLASFGPLIVDPGSPDYGLMLPTAKPHWAGFNLRAALAEALGAPIVLETDVSAAALAEQAGGAGAGLDTVAYITVGTGIGGGLAIDGRPLKGALHPEVGHLRVHRHPGDTTPCVCPFHNDCAEGMAAGPAIAARLAPGEVLQDRPVVQAMVADYLGQLCASLVLAWSPRCIVMGGGLLTTPGLLDEVGVELRRRLGPYVGQVAEPADYLRPPAFADSGLEGAMILARRGLAKR